VTADEVGPNAGPGRDVVVVGASAGGVEALVRIARALPEDFPAAIFVALHGATGYLASILERAGPLRAYTATDGEPVESGRIYVAPNDHHLVLERGRVRALRGPRVNGHRPSVDVLFHSAARSYDGRTIGVVLSGTLTDGTLGLRAIRRRGGEAVVQADPVHEEMPASALTHADAAALPVDGIAERLTMLVSAAEEAAMPDDEQPEQTDLEAGFDLDHVREAPGAPSPFICPECGGSLWEHEDGDAASYVCHVGHAFSADSLLDGQVDGVERALWSAVRQLEEHAALVTRLADRMGARGQERSSARFRERARVAEQQADLIRRTLLEPPAPEDAVEQAAS
jgi:two-component system, chemotaxis family, protein-glutamate methylesterase/glutaminase